MDQERISQRAYALWENAGKPDGAHDEHWHQASREIEADGSTTMSDQTPGAEMPAEKMAPQRAIQSNEKADELIDGRVGG